MSKFNLQGITVLDTQLTSATANDLAQCPMDVSKAGGLLKILFQISYPTGCDSATCRNAFANQTTETITQVNNGMALPFISNNGQTINVNVNLCSLYQTGSST